MSIIRKERPALIFFGTDEAGNKFVDSIRDSAGYLLSAKEIESIIRFCNLDLQELSQLERDEINRQWRQEDFEKATQPYYAKEDKAKGPKKVFLYLMKDIYRGFVKIGITNNITKRLTQLRTANPGIELIKYFDATEDDEVTLHAYFKKCGKRVDGEWFTLGNADIEYIKSYFQSKHAEQ